MAFGVLELDPPQLITLIYGAGGDTESSGVVEAGTYEASLQRVSESDKLCGPTSSQTDIRREMFEHDPRKRIYFPKLDVNSEKVWNVLVSPKI